jgi:hypothetical protein
MYDDSILFSRTRNQHSLVESWSGAVNREQVVRTENKEAMMHYLSREKSTKHFEMKGFV